MSSSWRPESSHEDCYDQEHRLDRIGKLDFVRSDEAIKLPPGFRFQPTDQEIVFQYLIRKVFACPLPASIIPDILNISKYNPRDLPGDWEQDRYLFSKINSGNGNIRGNYRMTSDGYWKETGFEKQITRCDINSTRKKEEIITGMKKTFVYYGAKPITRTRWIMHEYRLVHTPSNPSTRLQKCWIQMGTWVLCHVYLKERRGKTEDEMIDNVETVGAAAEGYEDEVGSVMSGDNGDTFSLSSSSSSSSCSISDSSLVTHDHEVTSSRILLDHKEFK